MSGRVKTQDRKTARKETVFCCSFVLEGLVCRVPARAGLHVVVLLTREPCPCMAAAALRQVATKSMTRGHISISGPLSQLS